MNWNKASLLAICMLSAVLVIWLLKTSLLWGACAWYGYETSRITRFSPFIGCMIQTPAGWVPRNELRIVQ